VQLGRMSADLGGAISLTIVSPFFSGHRGITQLAAALSCERISVAVPPVAPSIFDFEECRKLGISVSSVACNLFSDTRSLHAKLFDIECRNGRLIVSGSANATTAALSGQNIEAVVARIVDRASSLGWRPSGTHEGHAMGERAPEEEASGACIVTHFDGRGIVGRMFGLAKPEGEWLGSLSAGTRREAAGMFMVNGAGKFRFSPPEGMDPITLPTSAQVILERDGLEIRGWLVLQELLHAIREKGPIARSFARMLSGTDTTADVSAILEYLAKAPATLLDAANRHGSGRKNRPNTLPVSSAAIPSASLQPVSAFEMPSTWKGGGVSQAFGSLLDALIRHFAASMPDRHDDTGDDEDDSDEPHEQKKRGSSPAKRGKRVPVKLARKAFDSMFAMLEKRTAGPDRIPGLYALFDMIVQIAPRCDEADELTLECSIKWLKAAQGCRVADGQFDALDKCVAVIVTKWVMDDPDKAVNSHAELQHWLGSALDETATRALEPDAASLDERRLAPGAVQASWSTAWRTILSTETPWAMASALEAALRNGGTLNIPAGVTEEEADILHSVASGKTKSDRVVALRNWRKGRAACPACHLILPWMQQGQLRSTRVATCDNLRCKRVIIDISF
jgi:hypothetical protein